MASRKPNEAVEKQIEGSRERNFWGAQTIPEDVIVQWWAIVKVDFISLIEHFFRSEFFYSLNVELAGDARIYRAASSDRRVVPRNLSIMAISTRCKGCDLF